MNQIPFMHDLFGSFFINHFLVEYIHCQEQYLFLLIFFEHSKENGNFLTIKTVTFKNGDIFTEANMRYF